MRESKTGTDTKVGLHAAEAQAISREEVAGIAKLARIALAPEELDHIAGQLDTIVEAVDDGVQAR